MNPPATSPSAAPSTVSKTHSVLIAGDTKVESIRFETESPFPVQRKGYTFDVHRHKHVNGCFLLKFLIDQCAAYSVLSTWQPSHSGITIKLAAIWNHQAGSRQIKAFVFADKRLKKKNNPIPFKHESVAIIRTTGLLKSESSKQGYDPRAPRLHDTHAIDGNSHSTEEIRLPEDAFGSIPAGQDSDVVLNLDMKSFWMEKKTRRKTLSSYNGHLVTRLVVPREVLQNPKQTTNVKTFIGHLETYLQEWKGKNQSQTSKSSNWNKSVLIISSESLRTTGMEVSYRVTWERSLSAIIGEIQKCKTLTPPYKDVGQSLRCAIAGFDYVIVCFYNDGAVIVPTGGSEKDAVLVALPSQIEGDHSGRFVDTMRGTETLVTAAVAFHLRSEDNKSFNILQILQKAVVHGVKASRHLQSHGYVTLHGCGYRIVSGEPLDKNKDAKETAYSYLMDKLSQTLNHTDIFFYLWNRTRSAQYAKNGLIVGAADAFNSKKKRLDDTNFCTWPLGDLTEILVAGHPGYGTFPPVGLKLEEQRSSIERETQRVSAAYDDAGWLEIGRFPKDAANPKGVNEPYPFWSLRGVVVERLAGALKAANPKSLVDPRATNVAVVLLCEMLIRYGTRGLNRDGMDMTKCLDFQLVKRVEDYVKENLPIPAFYYYGLDNNKCVFDNSVFDFELFLNNFLPHRSIITTPTPTPKQSLTAQIAKLDPWYSAPFSGSWLGLLPECRVRQLQTIDVRDTQSYRDLRERLKNFQASSDSKPLNLAVLGTPGSGKSFGVCNIVEGVFGKDSVQFLEYNLASFSGNKSLLTSAFLEIQNASLQGRLPVVFWDEFDTTVGDVKLAWLASFLGPMQDGKFLIDQNSRHLPKCVFIFAGSIFSRFDQIRLLDSLQNWDGNSNGSNWHYQSASGKKFKATRAPQGQSAPKIFIDDANASKTAKKVQVPPLPCDVAAWRQAKGKDFKSRITGVLDVHSVDPPTAEERSFGLLEDEHAWLFRRAAAIRQSFERQAPHMFSQVGTRELQISDKTLFALLTLQRYDHGYRSIESLVKMSSLNRRAVVDGSVVPTEAQVRIHAPSDMFGTKAPGGFSNFPSPPVLIPSKRKPKPKPKASLPKKKSRTP